MKKLIEDQQKMTKEEIKAKEALYEQKLRKARDEKDAENDRLR